MSSVVKPKELTWVECVGLFCGTQDCTPLQLAGDLDRQRKKFNPTGWVLLECQQLDSRYMGTHTMAPFGPTNTFKEPPTRPVSPRGLSSDMSVVIGILLVKELPMLATTTGAASAEEQKP